FQNIPLFLNPPKKRRTKTSYLANEDIFNEIDNFLSAVREKEQYIRVPLYLMLFAGLRVGEVVALKTEDIRITDSRLVVFVPAAVAKGCKERVAPYIDSDTAIEVWSYVQENPGVVSRIRKRGLQAHVEAIAKKLGARISCHSLRRFYASTLLSRGVKLETIQACLGHEDIRRSEERRVGKECAAEWSAPQ